MPTLVDANTRRVVAGYQTAEGAVRAAVLAYVDRAWGSLSSWRAPDIERFVDAILPVVVAGQVRTAALTDAYLAAVERVVLGSAGRTVGVSAVAVSTEALRGVPARDVYLRAGKSVWRALAAGAPLQQAVSQGRDRARSLAGTDLQLAKRDMSRQSMSDNPRVVGYRRVLRGGKSCGLCIVASTQRYRKQDLLPIHPACDCNVMPIFSDRDPGQVIDVDRLEGAHDRIAERFGAFESGAREIPGTARADGRPISYRDVLVVHEHGELGPVLGVRGQHFDGPQDIDT